MKKLLIFSVLIAVAVMAMASGARLWLHSHSGNHLSIDVEDLDSISFAEPGILELSFYEKTLSNSGGRFTLGITANKPWTASVNDPGLILGATSGEGNAQLAVTAMPNTDEGNPYTGIITITLSNGVYKQAVVTVGSKYVKIESIYFKESQYRISEIEDINLKKQLVVVPENVLDTAKITWSVSDENIAVMNGSYLEPNRTGDVRITATIQGKSASCMVEIAPVPVESIFLEDMTVALYSSSQIKCTTIPEGVPLERIRFSSSNNNVVYVTSDGIVQGKGIGTATITAMANGLTATCKVTVTRLEFDKNLIKMRAYGDTKIVNVKCAVSVHAKASESWIHLSATSFGTNLGDGYDLYVSTDAATSNYATSGYVRIYIDDESYADVIVEREGRDDTSVRDVEGHTYGVVKIQSTYWMSENLKCRTYDTHSEAPGMVIKLTENGTGFTGKACVDPSTLSYLGTMESYKNCMGYLYNWIGAMGIADYEAASTEEGEYDGMKRQGICPNGFRLPTKSELESLKNYADGQAGANNGGKFLKTTTGWDSSKDNGTDGCGFHAYPCGVYKNGSYSPAPAYRTSFWSSTSYKSVIDPGTYKYCMGLPSIQGKDDVVIECGHYENEGMSVRCVRKN